MKNSKHRIRMSWTGVVVASWMAMTPACPSTWVDTAFWKPYAADPHTYALLSFDAPAPMDGTDCWTVPAN